MPCHQEYNNSCGQHYIEFKGNGFESDRQGSDKGANTENETDIGYIASYDITRKDIRVFLKKGDEADKEFRHGCAECYDR